MLLKIKVSPLIPSHGHAWDNLCGSFHQRGTRGMTNRPLWLEVV